MKLSRLAARVHVNEGTLARSLLATALDDADPSAEHIAALLDGFPGAYERARLATEQAERGETIPLRRPRLTAVARGELAAAAVQDLERLIQMLSLPEGVRSRVQRSLPVLAAFPLTGLSCRAGGKACASSSGRGAGW